MWAAPTCQGFLRLGEFFFYSDVFFSAVKSYFAFELVWFGLVPNRVALLVFVLIRFASTSKL